MDEPSGGPDEQVRHPNGRWKRVKQTQQEVWVEAAGGLRRSDVENPVLTGTGRRRNGDTRATAGQEMVAAKRGGSGRGAAVVDTAGPSPETGRIGGKRLRRGEGGDRR